MLAAKGLLEALAKNDTEEPLDKNTVEDKDLGEILDSVFRKPAITCNRDCEKCRNLSGRAEKNGQPWGYECLKHDDTVEKSQFHSTKTFWR